MYIKEILLVVVLMFLVFIATGGVGVNGGVVQFGNVEDGLIDSNGKVYTLGYKPFEPKVQKINGGWIHIRYRLVSIQLPGMVSDQWFIQNLENGNLTKIEE